MKRKIKFFFIVSVGSMAVFTILNSFESLSPNKQDQHVTLTLSIQELNVITKGLGKLPLEESFDVFASIQRQVTVQLAPKKQADSVKPKKN